MPEPTRTAQKTYLATVVCGSGVTHMWTSLLNVSHSLPPKFFDELRIEALRRFKCFASKHLNNVSLKKARVHELTPVESFPGRFGDTKNVTDVLNYFSPAENKLLAGKIFVFGLPPNKTFRLLEGPIAVNNKSNPEFFPKIQELRNCGK